MKKRFALLLTVILLVTMVLAPTANADTRLGTATVSTGANLNVLPVVDHTNLIPVLGVSAGLRGDALAREIRAAVNGSVYSRRLGLYSNRYDWGTLTTWNFGNCFWKGFYGTAYLKYYKPLGYTAPYADDVPYYEFCFDVDPNQGSVHWDGCTIGYEDYFQICISNIMWRSIMSYSRDYGQYYGEGPNGEMFLRDPWDRDALENYHSFTMTMVLPN